MMPERTRNEIEGDYVVVQRDEGKESLEAWEEYEFAELCDITRGASPRPIHDWISDQGIPWLKIADASATHSRYITQTRERIKSEGITKSVSVIPGDLILSNSATPGIPKFVGIAACIHDGWLLLRNMRHLEKLFCYYLLLFERPRIVQQGSGTVFTNLKTEILKRHRVKVPPLSEQRAIAHVLGTLDDKIELNRRMNETLEEMARALFKSWFVDFEPVRAKMEGRWRRGESFPGLPADLYDIFPDRLAPSELGDIPEGWEVGTISQLAERIFNGGTPKRSEPAYWKDGEVPWLTSGEVRQPFILETQSFITKTGLKESSAKMVPERAILVALYGATAGQVSMNFRPLTTNQAISAIIPNDASRYYCLVDLKLKLSELQERAVGSAQQNISKKAVETTVVLLPPVYVRARYNELVGVLFDRILENLEGSRSLIEQRDALLPGLVGGKLPFGLSD